MLKTAFDTDVSFFGKRETGLMREVSERYVVRVLWICLEIPLTMWAEAVSISATLYCDTLSRQQRSRRYFLCSRDDDVML